MVISNLARYLTMVGVKNDEANKNFVAMLWGCHILNMPVRLFEAIP